jgi:hypothetical protein
VLFSSLSIYFVFDAFDLRYVVVFLCVCVCVRAWHGVDVWIRHPPLLDVSVQPSLGKRLHRPTVRRLQVRVKRQGAIFGDGMDEADARSLGLFMSCHTC